MQCRVVAHHHHVGEEGIQRCAEGRQWFQGGAVVAGGEGLFEGGLFVLPRLPQRLFGGLLQQGGLHCAVAFAVLFQDVADAFGACQQVFHVVARGEGVEGADAAVVIDEVVAVKCQHGLHGFAADALFAVVAVEAFADVVAHGSGMFVCGKGGGVGGGAGGEGAVQRQVQVVFVNEADEADGHAAQGVGVFAAGRFGADGEAADEGVEFFGERQCQSCRALRQFAARAARVVLFVDGGGDVGGQAFGSGVVAPHDALQFGKFHHHFAEKVAF